MSTAGALIFWLIILASYWIPTVVAGTRHVPNLGSVFVINLLAGWTFVGWVVALAMAARSVPKGVQA
jgi:hypothetical protein